MKNVFFPQNLFYINKITKIICICGQYRDGIDNVHVCRQYAEIKLWMIGYMRSARDDKQMMCACADNMQMTWTMCVCAYNVQKLGYR